MAHLLTDEAFALSIGHFRRLGCTDEWGYWIGAIVSTFIPWNTGDGRRGRSSAARSRTQRGWASTSSSRPR